MSEFPFTHSCAYLTHKNVNLLLPENLLSKLEALKKKILALNEHVYERYVNDSGLISGQRSVPHVILHDLYTT